MSKQALVNLLAKVFVYVIVNSERFYTVSQKNNTLHF